MTLDTIKADITKIKVDAIVNAANSALAGGGGVDGAIHRAAGQEQLDEACAKIGHCPTGAAVITPGFKLPARYIIHTVGPVYQGTRQDAHLLASCYEQSLNLAKKHALHSVAFAAISTGVYGYPKKAASQIAVTTVKHWLAAHPDYRMTVLLVAYDSQQLNIYKELL